MTPIIIFNKQTNRFVFPFNPGHALVTMPYVCFRLTSPTDNHNDINREVRELLTTFCEAEAIYHIAICKIEEAPGVIAIVDGDVDYTLITEVTYEDFQQIRVHDDTTMVMVRTFADNYMS